MTKSKIGVAGTGRMGTAIAQRLIETGRTVSVWNRTPERTDEAVKSGAVAVSTPRALADNCETILTSLTDYNAIQSVYQGTDGLLSGDVGGRLFIELSTILPREQIAIAESVTAAGAEFLECPVGGTVAPALKGQLLGLAGGSADSWQRAEPLLKTLCKRVDHIGAVGSGSQMKLAVNLPLAIYWNVLGESYRLVEGSNIDPQHFASLIADSSAGPNVMRARMDLVASALGGATPAGTFDIDGFTKDLSLALRWAEESGAELPIAHAVTDTYKRAQKAGLGTRDGACLAHFVNNNTAEL